MESYLDHRRATWLLYLALLCLLCTVATSQDVGDVFSASSDEGASDNTSAPPSTTAPSTTAPSTTTPATTTPVTTIPATTTPTRTTTPTTRMPTTSTPSSSSRSTSSPSTSTPEPVTPTQTTKAPTATTSSPVTQTTTPAAASSASTTSESSDTETPAPTSTTAAPVVKHYNASTLPPGISSSVLNGSDLVNVEVTETTMANGTTSYDYVIVTDSGAAEKVVVVSPTTDVPSNSTDGEGSSAQSDSSSFGNNSKSSGSLGFGAIFGAIVAALIFILALMGFLVVRHRRNKKQSTNASTDTIFALPAIGKQVRLLDQIQSMADTEYEDTTRTLPFSGVSMLSGRRSMWEHPAIVASRIPIDNVELGEIISRGAFGVVYHGRYRDQDVAIKTLLPEKRKDINDIEVFLSEVKLMATMEHPNIVQFFGVAWEALSELYCVTEFMSGGDLRALLKEYIDNDAPQGMDVTKMQIAYDVAYALTYMHSLEPAVLHRDLKSRNILLTQSLTAKITDFGTSRVRSDGSMTSNVGSSLWMAPEVMMGRRYDEKADVFSLGVVMSELDTHELPYSHAKESNNKKGRPLPDTAVLQMVSMGKLRVQFSPFMDQEMAHFIERCVAVDPQERPTAAEALYVIQVAIREQQS
ncbi:hypothetical protein V7S43_003101 [Phytophthora oleae]|uniref:Protein kinase domain-containing protein n=1 Tax=Phytophthora oleae TaxID=2107226 RepID=A0ABD3G1D0_9STRA